ncbi:MAG: hypothetical protein ACOYKE_04135, partial [Ferruginibacter sp.]
MINAIKQQLVNHLKNLHGFSTPQKIVVLSADDYGNIRLASKAARDKIFAAGLQPTVNFDYYDALENAEDLDALYETLLSVKDQKGKAAILTAFCLVENLDFNAMREEGFTTVRYQKVKDFFAETPGYENTWALWESGIKAGLIEPQFHGRAHFNKTIIQQALDQKDQKLIAALEAHCLAALDHLNTPTAGYTSAFDMQQASEITALKEEILLGLQTFDQMYHQPAIHFNACGSTGYNDALNETLAQQGIQFLDTSRTKKNHLGNGQYGKTIHAVTGDKNAYQQTLLIRNCFFEPTDERGIDWVSFTTQQVAAAFRLHKPAI